MRFTQAFKGSLKHNESPTKVNKMSDKAIILALLMPALLIAGCKEVHDDKEASKSLVNGQTENSASLGKQTITSSTIEKPVVYQVFTRLFGNKNTLNKPWGTKEQNGVGKFSDFDDVALQSIKALGTSHIWYTGVPHHALVADYKAYGISDDDPDVVKGRAGSPYAVKDYYNVNPDLADNVENRLQEFKDLIKRTHENGMKVIIDIVPNHVARSYQSPYQQNGVTDFGVNDDTSVSYKRHNNFYYVVNDKNVAAPIAFKVPKLAADAKPLGGGHHPLADAQFEEVPAKWTGNGSRAPQPDANDWYETVKINYGVKPDGTNDFPSLPANFARQDANSHYQHWLAIEKSDSALPAEQKSIPDSWTKFKQITQFWLAQGVDGFRYDMAEMVPVAFWSYLNSNIKHTNPDAFLLAEVYNPALYRDYIHLGKMDYLYDKVDMYDTLKEIIRGSQSTAAIARKQALVADIAPNMLHFLENHDEQRIASNDFAGDPFAALPAMVISTTISSAPTLIYFGQDVGEKAAETAGFGSPTRTSIFDYVGVPAHQRYMNNGKFDGGQSTAQEIALRAYYTRLLNLSHSAPALTGEYQELDSINRANKAIGYDEHTFAFSRYNTEQQLIIVSNFSQQHSKTLTLQLPNSLISKWNISAKSIALVDLLIEPQKSLNHQEFTLTVDDSNGYIALTLAPNESKVLMLIHQ